jgi:putative peptidoglycan lipid II flippase
VTTPTLNANRQIARAAGTVMLAFILSNLTGLIRQILVSSTFGTQNVMDAYNAASTYPDLIFSIIAGGALASAFIPTLSGFVTKGERRDEWRLSSAIINLVLVILTVISILSAIYAEPIVKYLIAPRYSHELQVLTASIMRILLLSPCIFGVSGVLMGILNVHQIFLWPALAPTMYWLGMIFGVLFLVPSMGIFGLAWGAVLGAALHLLIQLPATLKLPGRQYFVTFGLRFPAVREVGRLMVPRLIGVAVVQLNFVVNTIIATSLVEGSLTSIKYAWAIMTMPQVIIAQAIAIAALPTFSAQVALGKLTEMRSSLSATLRGVVLLSLPATFGLIILRSPIISMLFERGEFDATSTQMVAWALLWYAVGLVGHSLVEITSRAFYALHDTKTPVVIGTIAMSMNVLFSFLFSRLFAQIGWQPFGGLAFANSLATSMEMVALLFLMHRRLHGLNGKDLLQGIIKTTFATLAMSLGLWLWIGSTDHYSAWIVGLGGVILGGIIFLLVAMLIRIREVRGVWEEVRARIKTLV